jgi:hypothetical protein
MNALAEMMKKKNQEIDAKKASGMKTWKPPMGKSKIRILPSWRDPSREKEAETGIPEQFWHDYGQHFVKTEKNGKVHAVHVCMDKTYGEPCDICQAIGTSIKQCDDDDLVEILKESNSQQKFLMNVLVQSDKNLTDPVVMEIGATIFNALSECIIDYAGDDVDALSLTEGTDFTITRSGSGFDTKYVVTPAPKSTVVDEAMLTKLTNLDNVVNQANETKKKQALEGIGQVVGIMPPKPSATASLTHQLADEADDAEFEELVQEEAVAESNSAPEKEVDTAAIESTADAELDEDDIDAMLADLDETGS